MGLADYEPVETETPASSTPVRASPILSEMAKRRLCSSSLLEFAVQFSNFEFAVDPFHVELCSILDNFMKAVEAGKRPLLVIYAPPRSGKSQITVRSLAPYALGRHPEWEVVVATHTGDFAADHGRDIREIMNMPYYGKVFPNTKIDKKKMAADNFSIEGKKGSFYGVGAEGKLTGKGANLLICDDLIKDWADARSESHTTKVFNWLQSVAMTRLDPDTNGMILMATRWSEIDPTGRLLDSPIGKKAHVFGYSALDENDESFSPTRMSTEFLLELRENLDPKIWSSLYQGCPVAEEGLIFRQDSLHLVDSVPRTLRYYITSDPAASSKETSDFWTTCVWGVDSDDNAYLVDMFHKRGIDSLEYIENLFILCRQYKPTRVYMERCHASNVLEPIINKMMREKREYYSFEYPTTGNKDKESRAQSIVARMAQKKVFIKRTPDLGVVIHELLAFPDGKNDDIVDNFSIFGRVMDTTTVAPPPDLPDVDEKACFDWAAAKRNRHRVARTGLAAREPRSIFS